MKNFDWYKIKFLESPSNLKNLIKEKIGKSPSSRIAYQIAIHVQHGRQFFETAASSPLDIRPLQLFYGILNFSKALVIAKTIQPLETLNQSHGVKDISSQNIKLENATVKIEKKGTFQNFNDQVCILNRVCYFDKVYMPTSVTLPTSNAKSLLNINLTLRDILSRIPKIEDLYKDTFNKC